MPELSGLLDPFTANDLEWRVQRAGVKGDGEIYCIIVPYVSARAVQRRLDAVCKPWGWQTAYQPIGTGNAAGFMCGIGILCGNAWVWKWDAADNTDIEPIKGGISGAFKRAAVHWGIGRYLYDFDTVFARVELQKPKNADGWNFAKINDKRQGDLNYWWKPPHQFDPKPPETDKHTPFSSFTKAMLEEFHFASEAALWEWVKAHLQVDRKECYANDFGYFRDLLRKARQIRDQQQEAEKAAIRKWDQEQIEKNRAKAAAKG